MVYPKYICALLLSLVLGSNLSLLGGGGSRELNRAVEKLKAKFDEAELKNSKNNLDEMSRLYREQTKAKGELSTLNTQNELFKGNSIKRDEESQKVRKAAYSLSSDIEIKNDEYRQFGSNLTQVLSQEGESISSSVIQEVQSSYNDISSFISSKSQELNTILDAMKASNAALIEETQKLLKELPRRLFQPQKPSLK